MSEKSVENVGVVESIETKDTVKGKSFVSYRISNEIINDFNSEEITVKVGDRVKFSYSLSANGKFKNLSSLEKLPGGGEAASVPEEPVGAEAGYVNPAFFGMVYNNSVQWVIHKGWKPEEAGNSEDAVVTVFNKLWDLAVKLKKEKNVT